MDWANRSQKKPIRILIIVDFSIVHYVLGEDEMKLYYRIPRRAFSRSLSE